MTEQGPPPQSPWTAPDERPTAVSPHVAASVAAFPYAAPPQPQADAFPAGPSPQPYAAPSQPYLAPNPYGAPPYPPAPGWPVAVFRSVRGLAVAVVGFAVAWTVLDVLVARAGYPVPR